MARGLTSKIIRNPNPSLEELDALSSASPAKAIEALMALRKKELNPPSKDWYPNPKAEADFCRIYGNALWRLNRFEDAKRELDRALQLYSELGERHGIMVTKNYLGVIAERMGRYPLALKLFNEAYTEYPEGRTEDLEVMLLNNIGFSYFHLSQYDEAMKYHDQALALAKKLGNPLFLAATYNNIGNVYAVKSQSDEAVQFFKKSLEISRKENLVWGINHGLNQITLELLKLGQYDKAIEYANESLSLSHQNKDERQKASALKNRAEAQFKKGNWHEAKTDLMHSLELSLKLQFNENLFPIYIALGDLVCQESEESTSQKKEGQENQWYAKALQLALEMQSKNFQSIAYRKKAEWLKRSGAYKEAMISIERHFELEKEMLNESSQRHLRNYQVLYEVEEAKRQAEIESQRNEALTEALKISEEANALKNDLLGIAAHDLKNPLQLISRLSQMIVKQSSPEKIQEYAVSIERSSRRMLSLVKSLIETAALEKGAFEFKKEKVDLINLLNEVLHENLPRATEKMQNIKSRIASRAYCTGDADALRGCFDNLISNAIKFSPIDSEIHVALLEHLNGFRFSVSDSGPGLSETDSENLFKPFKKLSAKPTGNESSSGLGLSITKKFIEAHNGRIWAERNAKRPGATFTIDLPKNLSPEQEALSPARKKSIKKSLAHSTKIVANREISSPMVKKRLRIGIVEDSEEYRDNLKQLLLAQRDFDFAGDYGSAEEAEEGFKDIDVILLDIGLPGKSGIEAIQSFKKKFPSCKIILITVFDDDLHLTRALLAGANGYLQKNASDNDILLAIDVSMKGGMPMSPRVAARVAEFFIKYVPKEIANYALTRRENEILSLLIEGLSIKQIATKLFISFSTVQNHLAKIYDKMHVNSKSEAVAKALKTGKF